MQVKRKIAIVCLLSGVVALPVWISGCASTGPLAKQEADYPEAKVDARGLFLESCATCHGQDGRAKTFHGWLVHAQNFTDPKWQETSSTEEIVKAINTGPGAMPAFAKKLSPSEIAALAAYVQTFKPAE